MLPPHPVQLNLGGGGGTTQGHYEPGETLFNEGDAGDSVFMILSGRVEVLKRFGAEPRVVRRLGPGEYFGEMALLGRHPRSATTRALTSLDAVVAPLFWGAIGGVSGLRRRDQGCRPSAQPRLLDCRDERAAGVAADPIPGRSAARWRPPNARGNREASGATAASSGG